MIQIANYVTKIFTAFGLIGRRNGDDWLLNLDTETATWNRVQIRWSWFNREATMRPVLQALSDFRKQVREMALKFEGGDKGKLLKFVIRLRCCSR